MDFVDELARFDRAVVAAGAVFDGVKVEQWGDPTPCTEWTVRDLVNHSVAAARMYVLMLDGCSRERAGEELASDA